jgi:hypothetical protein
MDTRGDHSGNRFVARQSPSSTFGARVVGRRGQSSVPFHRSCGVWNLEPSACAGWHACTQSGDVRYRGRRVRCPITGRFASERDRETAESATPELPETDEVTRGTRHSASQPQERQGSRERTSPRIAASWGGGKGDTTPPPSGGALARLVKECRDRHCGNPCGARTSRPHNNSVHARFGPHPAQNFKTCAVR